MRLSVAASVGVALVASLAASTTLATDPFYEERWGQFYRDLAVKANLPAGYRIMSPWGGPGFSYAWENVPNSDLDMMIRWQDGVYYGLQSGMSDWWAEFLHDVVDRPENAECFIHCSDLYYSVKNATKNDLAGTWTADLDFLTWEKNYDAGMYRKDIRMGQDGKVTKDGAVDYMFEDMITMSSLEYVNVTPGNWFVEGFMWASRNSYSQDFGHGDKTVSDVWYNKQDGMFNALTVGILVTNNISITTRTYSSSAGDVNSTSHFPREIDPYVIGFVQKPLPYEAPCPTSR